MYYLSSFQEMIKKASVYRHPLANHLMDPEVQKGKLFFVSLCNLTNSKKTKQLTMYMPTFTAFTDVLKRAGAFYQLHIHVCLCLLTCNSL